MSKINCPDTRGWLQCTQCGHSVNFFHFDFPLLAFLNNGWPCPECSFGTLKITWENNTEVREKKWKFKKNAKPQGSSDGFWYDITGGYIKPEKILADKTQIEQIESAIELLKSFREAMEEENLIIEF